MRYQLENFNGEYDFRCRFHDSWEISANLHEYSELLFCKQGAGNVIVNGRCVPLESGQIAWIPPNYIHKYDFPRAQVICAVFSNDFIPLFFKALAGRHFRVTAIDTQELRFIPDLLLTLTKKDYLQISGYLNLLCHKVMAQASFEESKHSDGVLYRKVISYLSEHYTENITLAQLAKIFGYNKKYLSHTLHELTGIQFRQLLAFYRIEHAKKLLRTASDQDITTIAMNSGFSALNTFHRTFKELTDVTPTEYRKRYSH